MPQKYINFLIYFALKISITAFSQQKKHVDCHFIGHSIFLFKCPRFKPFKLRKLLYIPKQSDIFVLTLKRTNSNYMHCSK